VESEPPYAYVRGNVVNRMDASGHEGFCFQGAPASQTFDETAPIYKLCSTLATENLLGTNINTGLPSGYHRYNNDEAGKTEAIMDIKKTSQSERTVVIGYSWGGAAALEVVNQLDREGVYVDNLVLIDPIIDGIAYTPSSRTKVLVSALFFPWGGLFLCRDIQLNNKVREWGRWMDGSTPSYLPPRTTRTLNLYATEKIPDGSNGFDAVTLDGVDYIEGAINEPIDGTGHQSIMQTDGIVNSETEARIIRFLSNNL